MAKTQDHHSALTEAALVGLLLAVSPRPLIPARPWPVAAACAVLAKVGQEHLPPELRSAAESGGGRTGEAVIERWLSALAADGALRPEGRGVGAHWVPAEPWLDDWRLIATVVDASERKAWEAAGQSFAKALSIWEKTLAAASRGPTASDSSA